MIDITQTREVTLEKIRVGLLRAISRELLDAEVDVWLDSQIDAVMAHIRGYIWGEEPAAFILRVPADWWQAVKERFFPRWLLKRFPIRYQTYTVHLKALYPSLRLSLPQHRAVLKLFSETDMTSSPTPKPRWEMEGVVSITQEETTER